jgi:hypothetical protein
VKMTQATERIFLVGPRNDNGCNFVPGLVCIILITVVVYLKLFEKFESATETRRDS